MSSKKKDQNSADSAPSASASVGDIKVPPADSAPAGDVGEQREGREVADVMFPLPAEMQEMPAHVREVASIVVWAKPQRGRFRAGRQFTREETVIPYGDLTPEQIGQLTGDPELIVALRLSR